MGEVRRVHIKPGFDIDIRVPIREPISITIGQERWIVYQIERSVAVISGDVPPGEKEK